MRTAFVRWLTGEGALLRAIPDYIAALCEFLNAHDFAIRRCNLATNTVHPQMVAIRHVWTDRPAAPTNVNPAVIVRRRQYHLGEGMIDEVQFNAFNQDNPQYRASPFYRVEQCTELCEAIRSAGEAQPFPVFDDLAAEGCTGYYGLFLNSFEGVRQMIGLATTRPGGFGPDHRADLRWCLDLFTIHLNTLMEYDIKTVLTASYLGTEPGQRVCDGMVKPGDVVSIESAIWFSDLRGFTDISDGLSAGALVHSLNAYFNAVVGPLYRHGGEVLKYVGDAILAIFPVDHHGSASAACDAALQALVEAEAALAELNAARRDQGEPPLDHGIGLHFGEAQYGNIGSAERLDFTLIGREVNVASRIEGLTKTVGDRVLMSASFAAHTAIDTESLGPSALKGIAQPIELFRPARQDS